jgi:transcriptional regulator GlxA family with amidase domain
VPPWRDGGQSQFIERVVPDEGSDGTAPTRAWALARLGEELSLNALAAQARMSVRTFSRRFKAETGQSPGTWLLQQRVRHACHLLETTDLSVDRVAESAGLGTSKRTRRLSSRLPKDLPRQLTATRARRWASPTSWWTGCR